MKAVYKKPTAHFEYLALSQTVASNCNATPGGSTLGKPAQWSKATCGWYMDENTILWVEAESLDVTFLLPAGCGCGWRMLQQSQQWRNFQFIKYSIRFCRQRNKRAALPGRSFS